MRILAIDVQMVMNPGLKVNDSAVTMYALVSCRVGLSGLCAYFRAKTWCPLHVEPFLLENFLG
jgi:hypothetical protein